MVFKRLGRAVLAGIVLLAGCHGGANSIVAPLLKSASATNLLSGASSRVVAEDVSRPALRSPDNAFALREPHDSRVHLHLSVFLKRSDGYLSQREYVTPFGLVVLNQKGRKSTSPSRLPMAAAAQSSTDAETPIAEGVTKRGAHWYLLAIEGDRWEVHLQFSDSTIDVSVPVDTPVPTVRQLVEEVY